MNYAEKYKHMKVVRNGNGIAVVSINRPDIMNSVPPDVTPVVDGGVSCRFLLPI